MARAMLEYTKTVLKKVSFDTKLFCKELKKINQPTPPKSFLLSHYHNPRPRLPFSFGPSQIFLKRWVFEHGVKHAMGKHPSGFFVAGVVDAHNLA